MAFVCSRYKEEVQTREEAFCTVDIEYPSYDYCSSLTPLLGPGLGEFILLLDTKPHPFDPPQSCQCLGDLVQNSLFRCVHILGIFRTEQCVRTAPSVIIQHFSLCLTGRASSRWRLRCVVDAFSNPHADAVGWLAQKIPKKRDIGAGDRRRDIASGVSKAYWEYLGLRRCREK